MSVLDDMTKGIIDRKDKAAALTPVGMERAARIPDLPGSFLAQEQIEVVIRNLRAAGDDAYAIAAELERSLGIDPVEHKAAIDTKLAEKEAERQADDRAKAEAGDKRAAKRVAAVEEAGDKDPEPFTERLERLKGEAQAATFVSKDADEDKSEVKSNWSCPVHGLDDVVMLISRAGRNYGSCRVNGCKQFQKP